MGDDGQLVLQMCLGMGGVADLVGVPVGVADLFGDSDLSRLMAGMALEGSRVTRLS